MAIIDQISIPVTDDAGETKRTIIHFPTGLALADVQGFWDVAAPEFDAVYGGLTGFPTVRFNLTNPGGLRGAALADHSVHRGALMTYAAAATNFGYSQYIPALQHSLITAGQVNVGPGAVEDWFTRMTVGEPGPPVRLPSDEYANDLLSFVAAVQSFRK